MSRNQWLIPAVAGVLGLTGGGTLGYLLGRRRGAQKMSEQVMEMLSELRNSYAVPPDGFKIDRKTLRPQPVWVNKTNEILMDDAFDVPLGQVEEVSLPTQGVVVKNVFTIEDETWDYEAERSTREGKTFYVIHHDEYVNDEMGFHQATLTYYAGDDILVDEADAPMYNFREQMDTFEFGKGSGDPNVVYVRNERESAEFEILLHLGRYEVEVLGLDIEEELSKDDLKHSVPRFRMD